jgi:hypothetical protein
MMRLDGSVATELLLLRFTVRPDPVAFADNATVHDVEAGPTRLEDEQEMPVKFREAGNVIVPPAPLAAIPDPLLLAAPSPVSWTGMLRSGGADATCSVTLAIVPDWIGFVLIPETTQVEFPVVV